MSEEIPNSSSPSTSSQALLPSIVVSHSWTTLPSNVLEQRILDVTDLIQVKAKDLRARPPVYWIPYLESGHISQSDVDFISAFQKAKNKEERDQLLNKFKDQELQSVVHVVQRVCIVEEIQKFLILIDDMLWEDMDRVKYFNPHKTEPWRAFLDLLSCADEFVRNISSRIIAVLISRGGCPPRRSDLEFYMFWLKGELVWNNSYLLSVARCLQLLLRVDKYRVPFFKIHGIARIIRLLTESIKPQAQYQFIFCLWMVSFNTEVVEKMNKYSTIPVLTKVIECCPAEIVKLPRIIMATFRNLLEKPREEGVWGHNALLLVQYQMLKCIHVLRTRYSTLSDPEHVDDLSVVEAILEKYLAKLSTFGEYRLELRSGRLEWSVVHTRKSFWVENAHRLNENNYELVRILILLLQQNDQDKVVLCVAAHDLGEYMSHHRRGKKVVVNLGGKDALLSLLKHHQPMVKFYALKCLQILMLDSYDLLSEYSSELQGPKAARSYLKSSSAQKALFGL